MEEKIVEFSTAKLAKEKGLDYIFVNYIYCIGYADIKASDKLIMSKRNNTKGQPHLALAPSQYVLQMWLMEKHKLYVSVDVNDFSLNPCIISDYDNVYKRKYEIIKHEFSFFEFQKALEVGLYNALNKITNGKD